MAFPYRFGLAPGQAPPPPPPPPPTGFHAQPPPPQQHGIYGSTPPSYGYHQQQVPGGYGYAYGGGPQMTNAMPEHHQTAPPATTILSQTTTIAPKEPQFSCDPCDLKFDTEKAYKAHRKSHVQCTDCNFQGSQKVVKAHYQALHGKFSGAGFKTVTITIPGCRVQKFKICVGNRPEDIQRWIADRKKKFPRTSSAAVAAEKKSTPKPETAGLSMLLAGYGSSSDDSDHGDDKKNDAAKAQVQQEPQRKEEGSAAIPLPNVETANDDAGIASPASILPPPATPSTKPRATPTRSCRFFFRNGTCRSGDACRFSHEVPPPQRQQNNNSRNNNNKRKRGGPTSSDTLLRKLLENDMDRESTLTMQLLKFIVKSNFFDDTAGNSKKKAKS